MALSAMRYPLFRNSMIRHYALPATAQSCPSNKPEIKVLSNKITIVAVDNNTPVPQVSIIFKAGSRNETYDTQGVSHMLRICAGLSTSRSSAFGIAKRVPQLGGELSVTSDREYTSYNLKIIENNLSSALTFLEDVATCQVFRPWEVSDEIPRLRYDATSIPDNVRLIELLYKAAFRQGLGYSLYCPKRNIGKINVETLSHFVKTNYTGSRCVVAASGVSLRDLESFASSLKVSCQESNTAPTKYYGHEIRKERDSQLANVAVAVEGASYKNEKDLISFAILQKVMGSGPHLKWGRTHTPLQKSIASKVKEPFAVTSFNASHTDSGLFGFILSAPSQIAGELTKAGVKVLRESKFTDDDITRGKACLKASVLAAGDSNVLNHESIKHQALFLGNASNVEDIVSKIDNISASDIKNAASKVAKGKLSLASLGNISTVPYVDQL